MTSLIVRKTWEIVPEHFRSLADDAKLAAMEAECREIVVLSEDDEQGATRAHKARQSVKALRVDVEKLRKELKADSLEYGRLVDAEAKKRSSRLEAIENYLQSQEDVVKKAKERKRAEKLQARIDALGAVGAMAPQSNLEVMSDEAFAELLAVKTDAHNARLAKEAAERQRIEQERLQMEAERQRQREEQEAERKRLAAERAEFERQQQAERLERERVAKIEADRLAAERAELHREKMELERQRKEKERAEQEERQRKAEAERVAAEEERRKRLAPDRVKLMAFAAEIAAIPIPEWNAEFAHVADKVAELVEYINRLANSIEQSKGTE